MSGANWRALLWRRLGWSLGAATLWTWGLLLVRMLRDGWQPLEVWFSYSLSFFMTGVYVYIGLLIVATIRAESATGGPAAASASGPRGNRLVSLARPLSFLGAGGLAVAIVSLGAWLALRFPGPQALSGTVASVVLAAMILAVAVVSTLVARGAR